MTFRSIVAEHYRGRGYEVRENVKVRGESGNVWAVDMVAQGGLGNLVVTFGGLDGLDASDVAQIKRIARDVGAAAVVAGPELEPDVRRLAAREGVAVLDDELPAAPADEPEGPSVPDVRELHPWPASGTGAEPAKTALRSVALDDLLGGDEEGPRAAPPKPTGSPAAQSLWGQGKQAPSAAQASAEQAGDKEQERFSWLRQKGLSHGGGYGFDDAEPAERRPSGAAAAAARQMEEPERATRSSPRASPHDRSAVLDDVRRRVDTITRPPAPSPLPGQRTSTSVARFALLAVLAGVVAAIVLWALLRFGP